MSILTGCKIVFTYFVSVTLCHSFTVVRNFRENAIYHSIRLQSSFSLRVTPIRTNYHENQTTVECDDRSNVQVNHHEYLTQEMSPKQESTQHSIEDLLVDEVKDDNPYTLPWTETQEWSLRDNVPRFTIHIPRVGNNKTDIYILWRNLCNEVPEVSGYPIEFLHQKYLHQQRSTRVLTTNPKIPLYLDNFHFATNGGVSGSIYGLPGISDGSLVTTNLVHEAERTVPKRYVLSCSDTSRSDTKRSWIVYELGRPLNVDSAKDYMTDYSLSGITKRIVPRVPILSSKEDFDAASKKLSSIDDNVEMMYLGGLTTMLLAGAYAVQILSHHLTVNMFWV